MSLNNKTKHCYLTLRAKAYAQYGKSWANIFLAFDKRRDKVYDFSCGCLNLSRKAFKGSGCKSFFTLIRLVSVVGFFFTLHKLCNDFWIMFVCIDKHNACISINSDIRLVVKATVLSFLCEFCVGISFFLLVLSWWRCIDNG